MTVYVDPMAAHGWKLRGHSVSNCHMFSDSLEELHDVAAKIGMKRSWFQNKRVPHYDLVLKRRNEAVRMGLVKEVTRQEAVSIWRDKPWAT